MTVGKKKWILFTQRVFIDANGKDFHINGLEFVVDVRMVLRDVENSQQSLWKTMNKYIWPHKSQAQKHVLRCSWTEFWPCFLALRHFQWAYYVLQRSIERMFVPKRHIRLFAVLFMTREKSSQAYQFVRHTNRIMRSLFREPVNKQLQRLQETFIVDLVHKLQ